ncbi:metallophosphoesterase family protein [Rhodopseudomonas palustris]|uniref:Metallophosphoesterase n=1 Tax=Rhodopseudomonas palustris (strain BisB18) TaxID=316056 RepID=Q219J2_RHOPB
MTVFTLAHLSDPHLPPMPVATLRELAGKRILGYLNWTKNRHAIHRRDVLDALMADLRAHRPDHIAVTGDLVNLALEQEFAPARRWIEQVGPPDRVSVIPGNHDRYVRGTAERFAETFPDYMSGDDRSNAVVFPFLRRRGPLVIIGVSTAVPTAPLRATGWLGEAQRAALEAQLASLDGDPAFRVLLIHHPLRSKARHKRLTDSAELQALLGRHGVDLVLHGHDHVHSTIWVDGPRAPIPVVGVPSASAGPDGHRPPAAYNLFSIARDGERWRCDHTTRGFGDAPGITQLSAVRLAPEG